MIKLFLIFLFLISSIDAYEISHEPPTAEEYVALRSLLNMKPRKVESAEKGLHNSLFWIVLRDNGLLMGMGRVISDGGTLALVSDIAVHPDYQKKGVGSFIFKEIQNYILKNIPEDAFVALFASKQMADFYKRRGFKFSENDWPGMYWPCADRQNKIK